MRSPGGACLASLAIAGALAGPVTSRAQDADPETPPAAIRLDHLRLSSPPALALLGIAASSVTRPATPRALIASLVSATGSSGLVPNGYAMETAPFWLASHPALDLRRYYNAPIGDRLKYFTAFSAATSRAAQSGDNPAPDARVALSVRTLLVNGRPSVALLAVSDSMRAAQLSHIAKYRRWEMLRAKANGLAVQRRNLVRQEDLLSTLVTRVVTGDRDLRDSTLVTLARRDSARSAVAESESAGEETARLEKDMDALDERLARLAQNFGEKDAEPDGLIVEIAAGTRALFSEGEWSRERLDGIGLWVTPMYRMSARHVELLGVVRYLTRVAEYDNRNLLDLGARAGCDIGKASLSGEWVHRSARNTGQAGSAARTSTTSSRWAALFSYPLPANLDLVASFGSDFRRLDGKRPVIATLGIDLGIGSVTLIPAVARH